MTAASLPVNICVLVVADAPSRRTILCDFLHAIGVHDVRRAASRSEVFLELCDAPVDAIILANCQAFDAIRLSGQIRSASARPYVPIILVVDEVDGPTALSARDSGVTEFLARPLTESALGRCLARVLASIKNGRHVSRPISAKSDLARAVRPA